MTFVGKILTVLILLSSFAFSSYAVMVYSTHRDWRGDVERKEAKGGKPVGLKKQLKDKEDEITRLKAENAALVKEAEKEHVANRQNLSKLASENRQKTIELIAATSAETSTQADLAKSVAQAKETLAVLTKVQTQIAALRVKFVGQQDVNDKLHVSIVEQLVKNQALEQQILALKVTGREIMAQIKRFQNLALANGLNEFDPIGNAPPNVDGRVLSTSGNYMTISIGWDEGLRRGHVLDVYKGGEYIGKIRVLTTKPDRSAAKSIDDGRKLNRPIRINDIVTTKFEK